MDNGSCSPSVPLAVLSPSGSTLAGEATVGIAQVYGFAHTLHVPLLNCAELESVQAAGLLGMYNRTIAHLK